MSEHFSTGVKIILARIESHPEEFREQFGKWADIMDAIHNRVAGHGDRMYALTDEEARAIHDKLRTYIWGPDFDDLVMSKVLDPDREERLLREAQAFNNKAQGILAPGKRVSSPYGWSDPSLLVNAAPGSLVPYEETKPKKLLVQPTYLDAAKKLLGIK